MPGLAAFAGARSGISIGPAALWLRNHIEKLGGRRRRPPFRQPD